MFPTITRSSVLNWCHCELDCCCIDKSLIKSLLRREEESYSEDRVLRGVGGWGGFLLVMVATTKQ